MYEKMIVGAVAAASAAVVGVAGYFGRKMHKLTKKIGMTVDDMAKAEEKDIQQELIERSVQKAADREVNKFAREAASEALSSVRGEVKAQVKKAVTEAFDDMKTAVEGEITAQIATMDHKALQKDVTEQAKKKILEKFDGSLDDILSDFSDNLDRVKKIHDRLADALMGEKKNGKEIRLNID